MSVGVGVIGTGVMGSDHAHSLAGSIKGASLVAICDADPDTASRLAAATGAVRIHADGFALIEDAAVDAVLIASPDQTHEDLVLACLDARKPVLCEKPLSPSIEGCLRVVAAETAIGQRLVQVGFMRRFDPGYRSLRDALVARQVGAPLLLHCVHRNASAPPFFDSSMLISNSAVHEIDVARWLLDDEVEAVTVFRLPARTGSALLDPQFIVMETRRGLLVDVEVFVNARYGYDVRAEVVCEGGTLTLAPQPPVRVRATGQDSSRFAEDWRAHFAAAYRNQLQAWVNSLGTGRRTGASAWDGYAATATGAACLQALHSGAKAPVRLQERPALYDG